MNKEKEWETSKEKGKNQGKQNGNDLYLSLMDTLI